MKTISILDINAFLYYESRLLDDEQWDEWLECYSSDAEFWMPSWDDNDELVTNPQEEISLIYYPNRKALRIVCSVLRQSAQVQPCQTLEHLTTLPMLNWKNVMAISAQFDLIGTP